MNHQPTELNDAVANVNKAIGELANNYDPWQVDKVADAMEKYFAMVNKYEPRTAIAMLESVYLGALLCGCRRNGEIANRFMAIRNRYAKQLESVKGKEVWE